MTRSLGKTVAVLAAVAAVLAVTGCSSGPRAGGDADRVLQVRIEEDPGALDPQTAASSAALAAAGYMYDTLVGLSADGKVVPRLASSWKVTPTSTTLTIRNDITCSDGTPLKPSDIKANFERLKNPATKAPYTANFLGSTRYEVSSDDAAGTLSISTPAPFGPLLDNLGRYPRIICPAGLADPAGLSRASQGTGPFVLDGAVPGDHYSLKARPGYNWGPNGAATSAPGFPRSVDLRVVANDTTAANQLISGGLDVAFVDGPERERLSRDQDLVAKEAPVGVTTLMINQAPGRPGADPAVRAALVRAIDRTAMTQAGLGGFGTVADGLLLPDAPCHDAAAGVAIPTFDPSAAKAGLAGRALPLKLYSISVPGSEYISEAWREVGVTAQLNVSDESGPGIDAVFGGGDWDAALISWNGLTQLSTMTPVLTGAPPPVGSNVASVGNPSFSRSVAASLNLVGTQACKRSTDAQKALFGSSDITPLSTVSRGYFAKGVDFSLTGSAIEPTSLRIVER